MRGRYDCFRSTTIVAAGANSENVAIVLICTSVAFRSGIDMSATWLDDEPPFVMVPFILLIFITFS